MKVGNWEIEDSVLGEQWAAWGVDDPLLGQCMLLCTPSGWAGYTTLDVTDARIRMSSDRLDDTDPFGWPIRMAIIAGKPTQPDVGSLDWDITIGRLTRNYSQAPVFGKLWSQVLRRLHTPQTSPEVLLADVGGPAKPTPQPYNEVIHTQTFYRESGNIQLALDQTVQNARSKMSTRSSYPLCKCCGQLTDWSTKWDMAREGIVVTASLVCPEKLK